ncbi:MAG: hypothetical protein ACOY94_18595 [Bacillota bacterium]
MARILVWPEELRRVSTLLEQSSSELQALAGQTTSALGTLGWQVSGQMAVEERYGQTRVMADGLIEHARAMSRFLQQKATAFDEADRAYLASPKPGAEDLSAWMVGYGIAAGVAGLSAMLPGIGLPVVAASTIGWVLGCNPDLFGRTPTTTPNPGSTVVPPPVTVEESKPPRPETPVTPESGPSHVETMIAKYFPKPEDRAIVRHTMGEEGPEEFGASWGGVVYKAGNGQWTADRQMLNFGLISFAFPAGHAGTVLRRILENPEEEQALREIAMRHLEDQPGGEIREGWKGLLRTTKDLSIAAKTKEQLVDEFIQHIKDGNDSKTADWLFKYANEETIKGPNIHSTELREDWQAVFSEWLSRPASQVAQLSVVKEVYFNDSVEVAQKLHLTSVRGVGFVFDAMVQGGSLPKSAWTLVETPAYMNASETEKLQMLRDLYGQGSTEWNRRDSVLKSDLSDDPYPF